MASPNEKQNRIGLSLSGGGYRAAAFHLGTLNKLNELGILEKVDVFSTISGGSITGAAWCLHQGDYPSFHKIMIEKLRTKSVIKFIFSSWVFIRTILLAAVLVGGSMVLSFTSYAWLVFPLLILFFFPLIKFQFQLFPVSQVIEKAYDQFFFHGKTLQDLEQKHILAIGSSNLHSGRPFTFSREKMSDSSYNFREEYNPPISFLHQDFPVARAVMASSCVPFAFSPVHIDRAFFKDPADYQRIKPVLVDGGVYDNQGIHKLTQPNSSYHCGIIITSDAGGSFIGEQNYPNAIALLVRTVDLFMYRIKAVQMIQNIYRNTGGPAKQIAYFSLGWKIQNIIPGFYNNLCKGQVVSEVIHAHGFQPEWVSHPAAYQHEIINHLEHRLSYDLVKARDLNDQEWEIARSTGTNLSCLSEKQVNYLVRHAENFTELMVKLYCPSLYYHYDK